MMRSASQLLLSAVCLATCSCGGTVSGSSAGGWDAAMPNDAAGGEPTVAPDGGEARDAPADGAIADAPPDTGPAVFCAGASKAFLGGKAADPAVVTSSMLAMNCCEGFVDRFHTKAQLGVDLEVMVRAFGALVSGDYVLPADAGGLQVGVGDADQPSWPGATASGTLRLEVPTTSDQPTRATYCLQVDSPGDALDGARLYGSDVVLAPWSWESRFEVRLLADASLNAEQAEQQPLDSLVLASGSPLFGLMSLAWYDASNHIGHWDSWYSSATIINQLPNVGVYGLPFVVLADGQRIYLGAFMTAVSSVGLSMPVIVIEDMQQDSFRIDAGYPGGFPPSPDPRDDPRIASVLASAGKLVP